MSKPQALDRNSAGTILYVGGFELPDRNAAAHRVSAVARIFRDLGYRVILLGIDRGRGGDPRLEPVALGEERIAGWSIGYPRGTVDWLRRIASPEGVAELLARERIADLRLVVGYNYPALAQLRLAQLAHAHGARCAADVTEWYQPRPLDGARSAIKNLDTGLRMRWVNRRMDGLIVVSPWLREFYARAGLPVVEIPTLVEPRGDATADVEPSPDDPVRLFFAGSGFNREDAPRGRSDLKDRLDWIVELLHAAQRQGARFKFDVFGIDEPGYLALVPEHRDHLKDLDDAVRMHGRRPHAEVLSALAAADFSIFLRRESRTILAGFPTKFAEAIASGTPVITNPMPATDRYIRDGELGFLLDPADQGAAAELARILALPPTERARLRERCRKFVGLRPETFAPAVKDWIEAVKGPKKVHAS